MATEAPLTPEEASAAADCVAAMLDGDGVTHPLDVFTNEARGGDVAMHPYLDEPATQARVAAARAALVKLREVAKTDGEPAQEWRETPTPNEWTGTSFSDREGKMWYLCRVREVAG